MSNYDSWLEAPYQRRYAHEPPADVQELLGEKVWVEEDDAWGVVEDYEPWSDCDEDGSSYGGIDMVVKTPSQTLYLRPDVVEAMMLITFDDRRKR